MKPIHILINIGVFLALLAISAVIIPEFTTIIDAAIGAQAGQPVDIIAEIINGLPVVGLISLIWAILCYLIYSLRFMASGA